MSLELVVFILFSLMAIGGALGVVLHRALFRSALFLILSFVGVAGFYVLLEVPVLAMVQLLVYVGAIAILIIFAIMLSRGTLVPTNKVLNEQWMLAWLVAGLLFVGLVYVLRSVPWPVAASTVPANSVEVLGRALVMPDGFVLPFEVASVLLLVALVGAVVIAREK